MSAKAAVDRIWEDLTDRQGIQHALHECDADIQEEIRNRLQVIIEEECGLQIDVPAPRSTRAPRESQHPYPVCFETFVKTFSPSGTLSRAEALGLAADLLAGVSATLDVETEVCESCQMHRHQNWDQKQGYDQLASAEKKIRKWATKL